MSGKRLTFVCGQVAWFVRRYWWALNPSRGVWCNDLSCKCKTCTVDGCECREARRERP